MNRPSLIAAWTPVDQGNPVPYMNISRMEDGSVRIIVREAVNKSSLPTIVQHQATVMISKDDWANVAFSIEEEADGQS